MCCVRICGKLFGSHGLLNKRRLTGNRPGSTRRETGRKKIATATPLVLGSYDIVFQSIFDSRVLIIRVHCVILT